jgi:hypothetical protein
MDENQWLTATDPQPLLEYLQACGPVSERKLRLWSCACVRRCWDQIENETGRRAVEVAEQYAEGTASFDDLVDAGEAARSAYLAPLDVETCVETAEIAAIGLGVDAADSVVLVPSGMPVQPKERAAQAVLFRHVFGNPCQPLPSLACLPTAVVTLAEALYHGNPVAFALHDALLETGHAEFAAHFQEAKHPKGCAWLDAILGKSGMRKRS